MSWLQKVRNNPWYLFSSLGGHGLLNWMSDELYLKLAYRGFMGEKLDLKNPQTFNQKLQWLKLHDRNPLYNTLVDKYRVKPWVAERIGAEHVTKTYGCWERAEDIDLDSLPEQFVLKTNHDSGGVVICKDKANFDFEAAKLKLNEHLKRNIYWYARGWPYKDVKPLVFAEEYLEPDEPNGDLYDYKLFRFTDGRPVTLAMTDRFTDGMLSETFFDDEWHALPVEEGGHPKRVDLKRPAAFDQMKALADRLGEGLPFVRVDSYESAGRLYFGELTFYPNAGLEHFDPEEWNLTFGSWIDLGALDHQRIVNREQ